MNNVPELKANYPILMNKGGWNASLFFYCDELFLNS